MSQQYYIATCKIVILLQLEDHQYCDANVYVCSETISNEKENDIFIEEKNGDAFLIELYRERSFLYNKGHINNFKNKLIKHNAWNEISKIMRNKNYGDLYTIRVLSNQVYISKKSI